MADHNSLCPTNDLFNFFDVTYCWNYRLNCNSKNYLKPTEI